MILSDKYKDILKLKNMKISIEDVVQEMKDYELVYLSVNLNPPKELSAEELPISIDTIKGSLFRNPIDNNSKALAKQSIIQDFLDDEVYSNKLDKRWIANDLINISASGGIENRMHSILCTLLYEEIGVNLNSAQSILDELNKYTEVEDKDFHAFDCLKLLYILSFIEGISGMDEKLNDVSNNIEEEEKEEEINNPTDNVDEEEEVVETEGAFQIKKGQKISKKFCKYVINLFKDSAEELERMRDTIIALLYNNYAYYVGTLIEKYDSYSEDSEQKKDILKVKLEEKTQKIKVLTDENKFLKKNINKQNNQSDMNTLKQFVAKIDNKVDILSKSNEKMIENIIKSKNNVIEGIYNNQIKKIEEETFSLKKNLTVKNNECIELTRQLSDCKNELSLLKEKIQEYNDKNTKQKIFIEYVKDRNTSKESKIEIFNILKNILKDDIVDLTKINLENPDMNKDNITKDIKDIEKVSTDEELFKKSVENMNVARKEIENLAYVTIENNTHMINFFDGSKRELKGLPENSYLINGQFIYVNNYDEYLGVLACKYQENGICIDVSSLAIVSNTQPLEANLMDGRTVEIQSKIPNMLLSKHQVVAINDKNEVVRAFKFVKFKADECMPSIKTKKQRAYFVLKNKYNEYLLRDIETGEEKFFNLKGAKIDNNTIVFLKNDMVRNVIANSKFYTMSDFYKNYTTTGIVSKENDTFYITTIHGEKIKVNNMPDNFNLYLGKSVVIDEFNNFLYVEKDTSWFVSSNNFIKKKSRNSNEENSEIETIGKVTIVGNPSYGESYRNLFKKSGYEVELLDGLKVDINEINRECKHSVALFVNTTHCSHSVSWSTQEEFKRGTYNNIKFFLSDDDGATGMIRKLKESLI